MLLGVPFEHVWLRYRFNERSFSIHFCTNYDKSVAFITRVFIDGREVVS